MKRFEFKEFLIKEGKKRRVAGNIASRANTVEKALGLDLDAEYSKDRCESVMNYFKNKGENKLMLNAPNWSVLPVGKYTLANYRLAIRNYVIFCDQEDTE